MRWMTLVPRGVDLIVRCDFCRPPQSGGRCWLLYEVPQSWHASMGPTTTQTGRWDPIPIRSKH